MIAITSISPSHINDEAQKKAVASWISCGLKVYSMNSASECESLKPQYPEVTFIETKRTMEAIFRKPYVSLSAIFDFLLETKEDYYCIINSDIELRLQSGMIDRIKAQIKDNYIIMANRINHNGDYLGHRYLDGIDVFFMGRNLVQCFPPNLFCLGQCHFDYFIPYHASQKGFGLILFNQDVAYHLNHNAQYNNDDWHKTGSHLIWLTNLSQFIGQTARASRYVFEYIYNTAKRINL